ncbi:MAG: hypothetical protein VX835_02755 [Pseudomonadota bacterium]|nr:hypothetical protein [Pseudomonadota bacterium]
MDNNTKIKYYAELALKIEELCLLPGEDFMIDGLMNEAFEIEDLSEDLENINMNNDIRANKHNELIIHFLKALRDDRIPAFKEHLKKERQTYDAETIEDFKQHPLFLNQSFISADTHENILQIIKYGVENPDKIAANRYFSENKINDPILKTLVSLKYQSQYDVFAPEELDDKVQQFIETISMTDDDELINRISMSKVFDEADGLYSRKICNQIIFRLIIGLDYTQLQEEPQPQRNEIIQALDFNPITRMVFQAYSNKQPIDNIVNNLHRCVYDKEDINEFKNNKLFKISSFPFKSNDQMRIIIKLRTGEDHKQYAYLEKKFNHLANYLEFSKRILRSMILYYNYELSSSLLREMTSTIEKYIEKDIFNDNSNTFLKDLMKEFAEIQASSSLISQDGMLKLNQFNRHILKKIIKNKSTFTDYNDFSKKEGFSTRYIENIDTLFNKINVTYKRLKEINKAIESLNITPHYHQENHNSQITKGNK